MVKPINKRRLLKIVIVSLVAAAILGVAIYFIAESGEAVGHFQPITYKVSGKIFADQEPLSNVAVSVNGSPATSTDVYGVFYLTKLQKNAVITFISSDYIFSPASITVTDNKLDYIISAASKSGEPEIPPIDPPVDPPVDPPIDPPQKPELPSPENLSFFHSEDTLSLIFCADPAATNATVSCSKLTSDLLIDLSQAVHIWQERTLSLTALSDTIINDKTYKTYALNITELLFESSEYNFELFLSAENHTASTVGSANYIYSQALSQVQSISLSSGVLSWSPAKLLLGAEDVSLPIIYHILINGIALFETSDSFIDLSDFLNGLKDGNYEIIISAVGDGCQNSVSMPFIFTV